MQAGGDGLCEDHFGGKGMCEGGGRGVEGVGEGDVGFKGLEEVKGEW